MRYTHGNVLPGTRVTDLDTQERLTKVLSIDTGRGEIEVIDEPCRLDDTGERVVSKTLRFTAVWPILDRGIPCLFHCHGRQ